MATRRMNPVGLRRPTRALYLLGHCILVFLLVAMPGRQQQPLVVHAQTSPPTPEDTPETENPDLPVIVVDDDAIIGTNETSLFPTILDTDTLQPSNNPTVTPVPTISALPSFLPSDIPSIPPSVSSAPSDSPSMSHRPTMTVQPSTTPSVTPMEPSNLFSLLPTVAPTISLPIFKVGSVTQDTISMILHDVPAPLGLADGQVWENITEHHILRFYAEIQKKVPGLLTFNVSNAYDTIIRKQTFTLSPASASTYVSTSTSTTTATTTTSLASEPDQPPTSLSPTPTLLSSSPPPPPPPLQQKPPPQLGQLELEYSQTIDYILFVPVETVNEDIIRRQVFTLPFDNDAQAFLLDLIAAFGYEHWIELYEINAGPTSSPTTAPETLPKGSTGWSRGAVWALALCLVIAAISFVAFLFRPRQERMYSTTHARDLYETMEYDNAGTARDWRNPFGSLSQDDGPPPAAAAAAASSSHHDRLVAMNSTLENQSRQSLDTNQSTVVAATPPDSSAVRPSPILPPMGRGGGDSSGGGGGGGGGGEGDTHRTLSRRPSSTGGMGNNTTNGSGIAGGGGGPPPMLRHGIFLTPSPHPRLDARHISVANTEITDLTFSEVGDRASDGAELFTLPPISDEAYMIHHDNDDNIVDGHNTSLDDDQDGVVPWSSLAIPQAEPYFGTIGNDGMSLRPAGLGDTGIGHHLTGFEMQVEELE